MQLCMQELKRTSNACTEAHLSLQQASRGQGQQWSLERDHAQSALLWGDLMNGSLVYGGMLLASDQEGWQQISPTLAGALSGSGEGLGALAHGGSVWDSGEWWMLLAAQSMAVGTVMVPWVSRFADPVMATGYHLLLGGLPLLALSACTEGGLLAERLPQLTGAPPAGACLAAQSQHMRARGCRLRSMPVKLSSLRVYSLQMLAHSCLRLLVLTLHSLYICRGGASSCLSLALSQATPPVLQARTVCCSCTSRSWALRPPTASSSSTPREAT